MWLSLSVISTCICVGVSAAVLRGYPLYLGFLAGWLCLPFAIIMVMLPRIIKDKITVARRHVLSDAACRA